MRPVAQVVAVIDSVVFERVDCTRAASPPERNHGYSLSIDSVLLERVEFASGLRPPANSWLLLSARPDSSRYSLGSEQYWPAVAVE